MDKYANRGRDRRSAKHDRPPFRNYRDRSSPADSHFQRKRLERKEFRNLANPLIRDSSDSYRQQARDSSESDQYPFKDPPRERESKHKRQNHSRYQKDNKTPCSPEALGYKDLMKLILKQEQGFECIQVDSEPSAQTKGCVGYRTSQTMQSQYQKKILRQHKKARDFEVSKTQEHRIRSVSLEEMRIQTDRQNLYRVHFFKNSSVQIMASSEVMRQTPEMLIRYLEHQLWERGRNLRKLIEKKKLLQKQLDQEQNSYDFD